MASKQFMRRIVDEEMRPIPIPAATQPVVPRKKAVKSEKRRLAALKTWEKRRMMKQEAVIVATSIGDSTAAVKVPHQDIVTAPVASAASNTTSSHNKRRIAALKTWEKRRAKLAASSEPPAIVPAVDDEQEDDNDSADNAAECIPSSSGGKAVVNKRSLAALKTWEKRRQKRQLRDASARPDAVPSSTANVSTAVLDEEDEDNETDDAAAVSASGYVRKHKKGYTAELRSQAAKASWEKRKRLKEARLSHNNNNNQSASAHDVTDISEEDSAVSSSKQTTSSFESSQPKKKTKRKRWDEIPESKRSNPRRCTSQELEGIDEATKDANQLITRLKHSRNWMEFHPSSRYGNGTADYAYIPGSLALLIRNGAFSKPIVMEHGTLGVHYALDYDGYGGLREMIDTFGEDYAPCPSDEMMDASLELQEKKEKENSVRADPWDLGEDLPWQEVVEMEDARVEQMMKQFQTVDADVPSDIEEVAEILASLLDVGESDVGFKDDTAPPVYCASSAVEGARNETETPVSSPSKQSGRSPPSSSYSPAMNALCCYDSGSSDDDNASDTESSDQEENDPSGEGDKPDSFDTTKCFDTQPHHPPFYYSQLSQESEDDNMMFGVPIYNPQEVAQYPTNEWNQDLDNNSAIPQTNNDTASTIQKSAQDGILFIQDNQKMMLLAPPEDEEVDEE